MPNGFVSHIVLCEALNQKTADGKHSEDQKEGMEKKCSISRLDPASKQKSETGDIRYFEQQIWSWGTKMGRNVEPRATSSCAPTLGTPVHTNRSSCLAARVGGLQPSVRPDLRLPDTWNKSTSHQLTNRFLILDYFRQPRSFLLAINDYSNVHAFPVHNNNLSDVALALIHHLKWNDSWSVLKHNHTRPIDVLDYRPVPMIMSNMGLKQPVVRFCVRFHFICWTTESGLWQGLIIANSNTYTAICIHLESQTTDRLSHSLMTFEMHKISLPPLQALITNACQEEKGPTKQKSGIMTSRPIFRELPQPRISPRYGVVFKVNDLVRIAFLQMLRLPPLEHLHLPAKISWSY